MASTGIKLSLFLTKNFCIEFKFIFKLLWY